MVGNILPAFPFDQGRLLCSPFYIFCFFLLVERLLGGGGGGEEEEEEERIRSPVSGVALGGACRRWL